MQTLTTSQANAQVAVNENFTGLLHQECYAYKPTTSSGMTWGFWGGRWSGFAVTSATLTLTASNTNHIVVLRSSGATSTSTASTNWDNTALYARVYKVTTNTTVPTTIEDHRVGVHGVLGVSGDNAPFALTSAASITPDGSYRKFTLLIAHNATLANPTNLVSGAEYTFRIKQDGTGGRTLAYGSKFKWPAGTPPVVSAGIGAVSFIRCYYDATDDILISTFDLAFA